MGTGSEEPLSQQKPPNEAYPNPEVASKIKVYMHFLKLCISFVIVHYNINNTDVCMYVFSVCKFVNSVH